MLNRWKREALSHQKVLVKLLPTITRKAENLSPKLVGLVEIS